MLRIVEEAARSDAGRQRYANEDAYFARSPVYAVADGMGGAQAGEVASKIAAEAFETPFEDGGNAEQKLVRAAREANRRIFELARSDSSRSGMGTTLTAALVSDDEVSVVHVGDSRAYLFRDRELRQLTRDHSLVEELRRQGSLTTEEAEEHPQRSIITRALGPEPEVELDVHTHQARDGDVFVLCSDGLTSMVPEQRMREMLDASASLAAAVDVLIGEANRMGGRDNITVVAFRVAAEAEGSASAVRDTLTDLESREVEAAVEEAEAAAAVEAAARPEAVPHEPRVAVRRPRRRRLRRAAVIGTVALLVVAGLAGAAIFGLRHVYFIGQDERGLVTLYRGLPYELPAGIKLYDSRYVSSVPVRTLQPYRRRRVLDHELRSRGDAAGLIRALEREKR